MRVARLRGLRVWAIMGWGLLAGVAGAQDLPDQVSPEKRVPVLVELFTSEGCSSCPPADALLRRLAESQPVAGAEIIVLSEHVDYWDRLGWRDRFSSPLFTMRQQRYAQRLGGEGPYTPEMVVDGRDGFVGGDRGRALRSIERAVTVRKLPIEVSAPTIEGRQVTAVATMGESGGPAARVKANRAEVFAVLVDPEDRTEVRNGKNGGKVLMHASVARVMTRVGTVDDLARGPLRVRLQVPEGTDPAPMRLVLFIEDTGTGAILGSFLREASAAPVLARR